jgi:hypothetical protein
VCTEPLRRRVMLTEEGPVLVHGPIEVVLTDGRRMSSDRAVTALCAIPFPTRQLLLHRGA